MTFDLFGDDPVAAPAAAPAVESFPMVLTSTPNEWTYLGVRVTCNMKLAGFIGHWQTVEPLGAEVVKSDRRVALCRLIRAHVGQEAPQ